MGEGVKTVIFSVIALVVVVAAVVSRPRQDLDENGPPPGPLFEDFDGAEAASLQIVKYNEDLGQVSEFKVARDKETGAWVIPSNSNYPADAEERITDATLMLDDLQPLGLASQVPGDHSLFGVLSPDAEDVELGDEGVGLLLTFRDDKDRELASLVIGHKVKDAEGQRFVRKPSKDVVYVAEIDPDKLSTKFEDWIKKDLLQLSSFDIEGVAIKNYVVDLSADSQIQKNFDFAARYKDAKWQLVELAQYRDNQPIVGVLGPDEELDKDKLNDLKTAVDNLEIVNVFRKPDGLGRDLKAGEGFMKGQEGLLDLQSRGFYLVQAGEKKYELLCANGEVLIGMKDGVEYVLRFGKALEASSDEEEETEEGEEAEETEERENRYLFAMARVDWSKLPEPETEELPELPNGGDAGDADTDETAAESTAADDADSTDASEGESTGDADESAGEDAEPKIDREAEEAEILRERERISKENERKLNEYNEKVEKAKEKVAELNTRFGDWYYVVSDEQCQKIFLGLDELIKKKEGEDVEGDGVDAFRGLQDEGLKKGEDDAT